MTDPAPSELSVSFDEVVAELDPLGQALLDGAQARAMLRKAQKRIAELENAAHTSPVKS